MAVLTSGRPAPAPTFLKDYRPPSYLVPRTELTFDLAEPAVSVRTRMEVERSASAAESEPLVLDGEELDLVEIKIDGVPLSEGAYRRTAVALTIAAVPARFVLEIETRIRPAENRSGEGLYISNGLFCTQMEAEGFRRVTYFPDRPDVLSRFTTTIIADKQQCPTLLSNGNDIERGGLPGGRHFVTWQDPFPKPCYLFALVAGALGCVEDQYLTAGGRRVTLRIYVEQGNEGRCGHAMESLKKAMRWDEEVFGLEYDLDVYMIVAVSDFNFGAMENKGLNIFNAAYVLADPESAADRDFISIERVIAHEYFHNWTGNRVTCRDWFQLTLKEGLTVFRDQEFSADMNSRGVKRIQDAHLIKTVQFTEDAGPNAHPIRPESYIEINNFYTPTVYNKGAEVIRMVDTLIGREAFLRGIRKYFELFDGQAVTTDDFLRAMELAAGADLTQFRRWYAQSGTPVCEVKSRFLAEEQCLELEVRQHCPPTPGQSRKQPFLFPLTVGLLNRGGDELPLYLEGASGPPVTQAVLPIKEGRQVFRFHQVAAPPLPSLLRNFSAPVRLHFAYQDEDLRLLLKCDRDAFCRFEAAQRLSLKDLESAAAALQTGQAPAVSEALLDILAEVMRDERLDPALRAALGSLPPVSTIAETRLPHDYRTAADARRHAAGRLALRHGAALSELYLKLKSELGDSYSLDALAIGRRALKNLCLSYLIAPADTSGIELGFEQFLKGSCMTDVFAALSLLCETASPRRDEALAAFHARWKADSLVMDKWFSVQAGANLPTALEEVHRLERHPLFDRFNPNKLRSLYLAFAQNQVQFHREDGAGYEFIADKVLEIDVFNANMAARLANAFIKFGQMNAQRKALMRGALERILKAPHLSRGVFEIAANTLKFEAAGEGLPKA